MLGNTKQGFGLIARWLHWSIALLLVLLFTLGWYMTGLDYYDPWYKDSFDLHRGVGVITTLLILVRIFWALLNIHPVHHATMKRWERMTADMVHRLLYLLMLGLPLSGYLISTARGAGIDFFGLFELPALLPQAVDDAREEWSGKVHYLLAFGGAWLVLAHGAAALKHHFIDRDDTLKRMLRQL